MKQPLREFLAGRLALASHATGRLAAKNMAFLIGITESQFSMMCSGARPPSRRIIKKMAKACSLSIRQFENAVFMPPLRKNLQRDKDKQAIITVENLSLIASIAIEWQVREISLDQLRVLHSITVTAGALNPHLVRGYFSILRQDAVETPSPQNPP